MLRALIAAVFITFSSVAPATAAEVLTDPGTRADVDRAIAYWGKEPPRLRCPLGVAVVVDQAAVAPNAATARRYGCEIQVGDFFLSTTPATRCAIIVHEWGHVIGHDHEAGLADDPLGVMTSAARPDSCSVLDPPAAPGPPADPAAEARASALAAWNAYDAVYVRWATQRHARSECSASANELRRRAARVTARRRCITRYGVIRRMPPTPAVPRPR